ncbi:MULTISPECIES: hypothetical protein [unclassified Lentimicrobium]|nr:MULTISPECIES: hypothetical protein [unclassified Lentimicrobium]
MNTEVSRSNSLGSIVVIIVVMICLALVILQLLTSIYNNLTF